MASPASTSADTPTGAGKLVKADIIADQFRSDIQRSITALKAASSSSSSPNARKPKLVGILAVGGLASKPSETYAEFTRKSCEGLGVEFVLKRVGDEDPSATSDGEGGNAGSGQGAVEDAIIEANVDDSVGGILVYYPIFGGLQDHYLQQVVSPIKDVEGLNVKFHYNLYHNIRFISPSSLLSASPLATGTSSTSTYDESNLPKGIVKSILPCTPLAIVKCLEYIGVYNKLLDYGDRAYGKTITVINRSEVVGRPLAALLSNDGARVFSVDIDSIQEYNKRPSAQPGQARHKYYTSHVVHPSPLSLEQCLALSDVVVSAVPSASYKVKTEALKDGCICVNVASEKNFESNVREKASLYIPAVGKVTILMLLRNLLRLQEYQDILTESKATS